jgi:hypothetical protein
MYNFAVDDEVDVCASGDGDAQKCRPGKIISAAEDFVTVQYQDGTEEVFGQDAPELSKRADAVPTPGDDTDAG